MSLYVFQIAERSTYFGQSTTTEERDAVKWFHKTCGQHHAGQKRFNKASVH